MAVIAELFGGLPIPSSAANRPRYNIAPTQPVLCARLGKTGDRELVDLRWGLVPFWAKDLKIGARMINARGETVAEKPSFRAAFKTKRCVVIADGFYEWKKMEDGKQPFYISRPDGSPFTMAGLWESWRDKSDPEAETIETCTIVTTSANQFLSGLHDRMPVILDTDARDFWLDSEFESRQKLESIIQPYDNDGLRMYPVSRSVNKAGNESAECVEEIELG